MPCKCCSERVFHGLLAVIVACLVNVQEDIEYEAAKEKTSLF